MDDGLEWLRISDRGSEFSRRDASCFLFNMFCFVLSFLFLSRNENVGLRGLMFGGVICNCATGGGEDGGVMVEVLSSSCDSSEKIVLFLRDGEDDRAATEVSRMARSRLSSQSSKFEVVFSLFRWNDEEDSPCSSLAFSSRMRFGGR